MEFIENWAAHQRLPLPSHLSEADLKKFLLVKYYYLDLNLTARETCLRLGVREEYFNKNKQLIAKHLNICFPKGLGHGGKRKGSGQKKKNKQYEQQI